MSFHHYHPPTLTLWKHTSCGVFTNLYFHSNRKLIMFLHGIFCPVLLLLSLPLSSFFHACVCVCVCEEALEVATLSRLVAVRKNLLFSNLRRPFIFKAEGRIGKNFCCCFVWWSLLSVFWCTGEYFNFYFIEPMTCWFPSSFWLQFNCFLFINIPTCEHLIHLKCICEAFISHYNTFPNIGETVGDCWATNIKPSKPTQ